MRSNIATNISIFNNPSFGSVRAFADENGEPWFVAADVAQVLGYDHTPHATRLLDDDEKVVQKVDTLGGKQDMTLLNESGLYHLVLFSKKSEAKAFRKWVTEEVLPALRKTGSYSVTKTNMGIFKFINI